MRVLHLRSSFAYAGAESVLWNLVPALARCGITSHVVAYYRTAVSPPPPHPLVENLRRRGFEAQQWPDTGIVQPRLPGQLVSLLREGEFDLLHTHDYKANFYGWLAARTVGVPCVPTVHMHGVDSVKLQFYRHFDLIVLRLFPVIFTVAESLREELIDAGIDSQKIYTIRNGIDARSFAEGARERGNNLRAAAGIDRTQKLVTSIGRLTTQKGFEVFLTAAERVSREYPGTRFWIVGEGPLLPHLKQVCAGLGLEAHVEFKGQQEDVAAVLGASDVMVIASHREGLPMVLLEAMAAQVPVVATSVSGIPEAITPGVNGLLAPPHAAGPLADAIVRTLRDPDSARTRTLRAYQDVLGPLSAERMADETANLYRAVVNARKINH